MHEIIWRACSQRLSEKFTGFKERRQETSQFRQLPLPLTGEERAGNVHGDRPAPSGLSRRRQRRSGAWPERQMSVSHCCGFFLQPLLVPTKAQQRLKCLCLSQDKRRQAGRNTSMSVLSRLSWLSPLPTLCRSWAVRPDKDDKFTGTSKQTINFGFSSQIYFQVSLISWISSQDKRPIRMINVPVTDTDDCVVCNQVRRGWLILRRGD